MQHKKRKLTKNLSPFAERFRALRAQLAQSQREFAEIMGLSGNTQVSKFEHGSAEPSLESLRRLAQVDITLDLHYLITGEPSPDAKKWEESYYDLLDVAAKYIALQISRLVDQRRDISAQLAIAEAKASRDPEEQKYVTWFKGELQRLEKEIADVTEDHHYVEKALLRKG